MSPTGRSYNSSAYNTGTYGGYTTMTHSTGADYSQGKPLNNVVQHDQALNIVLSYFIIML